MSVDTIAAERFVLANARLLDRHRFAAMVEGAPVEPVLSSLRGYLNPDGGFGHALEPDVRAPESEPSATLAALEVLDEVGRLDDPMVADISDWLSSIAESDGGVPFVMPSAGASPHAPFITPRPGSSFLTFGLVGALLAAGFDHHPWVAKGTEWCWANLDEPESLGAYGIKCALAFLDAAGPADKAEAALDRIRPVFRADGSVPVTGGEQNEQLHLLTLSPRPNSRSRRLFTEDQVEADLDRLERGQRDDGGWAFDWLTWSPGQEVEYRGLETVRALRTLRDHGLLSQSRKPGQEARGQ
jgi:hypothetical protein